MPTPFEKLSILLEELFQLDQADLDFGIYRIMNQRRDEINRFLKNDLLPQVKSAFAQYRPADKKTIESELQKAILQAQELGVDPDLAPKVKEIREQLSDFSVDTEALENEVYSHLYSFFRRYYDNGDFISMRRYKEGVYAIPYEGEEIKLHWANADQYYIKTTENFRDYTFRLPSDRLVHFKIVEAEAEKDNVKAADEKYRRFFLATETPLAIENDELFVFFEYRLDSEKRDQKVLNNQVAGVILANTPAEWKNDLSTLAPTVANPRRTLLEKHLADYTARNTFDYFIHKDLRSFLRRELDFYIKNEVMRLDDIENENAPRVEQYLSKIKALRSIAHKIIEFLSQIEDFQKKLWLKKKFVVETNYCITLDRVPEVLYSEIAANEKQREEWVRLFAIDEIKGDMFKTGYSEPLTVDFLKSNQTLVLDTKLFMPTFVNKLLSGFNELDEQLDGILIMSENFQALRLLERRYQNLINCVYIDPPFNLGENADYLYKVDYKDSTWLTLLENRLSICKPIMNDQGSIFVRCSHDGNMILRLLLNEVYGSINYRNEIILRRAEETKGDLNKQFGSVKSITVNYDNIYWYSINPLTRFGQILKPTTEEQAKSHWHSFWKAEDRQNLRYDILGIDLTRYYGQWMWKKERAYAAVENYKTYLEESEDTHETLDDYWERTGKCLEFVKRDGDSIGSIKYWIPPRSYVMADNNWLDIKGYANKWSFKTENSEWLLRRIFGSLTDEGDLVLDYFLGSGTSTAVAQKMGRKWLGIEMGNQFYSNVLPRMREVLYGEQSGISSEVSWKGGGFYKYIKLESFEDTLNNLIIRRKSDQQIALDVTPDFRENYILSYMLNVESQDSLLNLNSFIHPFDYQLNISTGTVGEIRPSKVDLVETFNYLIGLRVDTTQTISGYKVVTGQMPESDRVLIIWRDLEEKSNSDLEAFYLNQEFNPRHMEFDLVYVNGDNNLENLRQPHESWTVRLIEDEFLRRMFDTESL